MMDKMALGQHGVLGGGRESGIELARILSMLLVVLSHAGVYSVGMPKIADFEANPVSSSLLCVYEAFTYVCVNIFVLISGWFGILFKMKRLLSLVFQVLFICFSTWLILFLMGIAHRPDHWGVVQMVTLNSYWFVPAYLILYLLSPLLNSFVESSGRGEVKKFLILFFIMQTVWGMFLKREWFNYGYSPLSFIGLYVLAQYIHRYKPKAFCKSRCFDVALYILLSLSTALLSILQIVCHHGDGWLPFMYLSPLVIFASVFFFLVFIKTKIRSRVINWVASSVFAVYLVNCEPDSYAFFTSTIGEWSNELSLTNFLLYSCGLVALTFVSGILIDRIRLFLWHRLDRRLL